MDAGAQRRRPQGERHGWRESLIAKLVWHDDRVTDVEIVDHHWEGRTMIRNGMRPVHPGEVLREDYLVPLGMSANALAAALRVTPSRINDIVRERRGVTADTALRLARYFGGDAQSWLNLQSRFDLRTAELAAGKAIAREVEPRTA